LAARPRVPIEGAPVYARVPEPPPGIWWENPWSALLAGLVALLLGGLVGYLIGNSNETAHGVTHTVTNTETVVHPKTITQTNTVTSSTVKETPAPANQEGEARRREAETTLRNLEKENRELRHQLEESGRSP
jgi:hypothetical protein